MLVHRAAVFLVLLVALLLSGRGPAADQAELKIEDLERAPFPSHLVAAPARGRVAWVFNDCGVRNIWMAESPDYKGKQVTGYTTDDGQEITGLAWAPDGGAVVYVKGNDAHNGRHINPRSRPKPPQQLVCTLLLDGMKPREVQLGEGHSPAPGGSNRVAFIYKGQIWSAPIDGSSKAELLIDAPGDCSQLRWSLQGAEADLAFVNKRGEHSFVGVYHSANQTIRWLDPSANRDSNPVWSPDGKRIAFLRLPAARVPFHFIPERSGDPWSIRVADVSSGEGRVVWKAEQGMGSVFREVDASNQLFWTADDRIIFPWERDGWTHLYDIPVNGGAAALLTPGKFEVESVSLSPDRKTVLFSSNQDDIDRRHIWSVSVSGSKPIALTSGKTIEWTPRMTSDSKAVAFLQSDARRPAHPSIQVGSAPPRELAAGSIPPEFPEKALVEPQPVVITAADGMKVPGQLFLPAHAQPGDRRPAILYTHGGSRRQMLLGWHMMDGYHHHYALNQYLAGRGFVVLSLNYRSGIGYGMEFREALDYGAAGASEVNDVLGAGLYLKNRPEVDPKRIGLWGGSYGGYLTALGLARGSELFAAGVDIHGVYDWNAVIKNLEPSYDPLKDHDIAKLAFESSPVNFVKTWRSPVLVIHGEQDPVVPFSESVHLIEDLRKQGVDVEQLVLPDEAHGFLTHEAWLKVHKATAGYLERKLQVKAR